MSLQLLLISCSQTDNREGENMSVSNMPIIGEDIASALANEQFESLYKQFSTELQQIVSLEDFIALSQDFFAGEQLFSLASSSTLNDYRTYIWHSQAKDKGLLAILDAQEVIIGIQLLPLDLHPETDELYSEVEYQLPYKDDWFVYWGGQNTLLNYHYAYEHMRYAYDFVKVKDGYSYKGDPLNNDSYYAFNQDVVAPATGVVIAVIDGIEDNKPGEMNEQQPEGNMVIIEHEHGEQSMLAHFKQHSIVVKVGDKVEAGQLLGKTGNSGHSSEAHIHFQVIKKMDDGSSIVVPIRFTNGKTWIKGDIAANE